MGVVFEDIIRQIGMAGRFQILLTFAVTGSKFAIAWGMLLMTFGGMESDWWCVPEQNSTVALNTTDDEYFHKCTINGTRCLHIQYGGEINTIIREFGLSCERKQFAAVIMTVQFAGALIVSVITGQLADLIGRKKTFLFMILIQLLFCVASTFSNSWELYAMMRFVIGGASGGVNVLDTTLPVEFTAGRWRSYVAAFPSWAVGAVSFALAAFILKDWKYISIATAVVTLPFLIGCLFAVGLSYYGFEFGVVRFSGNIYLNLFFNGFVDIPAAVIGAFCNNKIGRVWTLFFSTLLCTLLAGSIVPVCYTDWSNGTNIIIGLAMSSKLCSFLSSTSLKLYTIEITPTVVRASALALGSTAARIGSLIAPQLVYLDQLNGSVMYVVIAALSLLSTGIIWFLPETNKKGIPDTIESHEASYLLESEPGRTS